MPAKRLYVDTSAYLCVLLGERGWERLAEEFAGSQLFSSVLLTLESEAMYSTDSVTDGGFSPVADNIIQLRYAQVPGAIRPTNSL